MEHEPLHSTGELPRLCVANDAPQRLLSAAEIARVSAQRTLAKPSSRQNSPLSPEVARPQMHVARSQEIQRITGSFCPATPPATGAARPSTPHTSDSASKPCEKADGGRNQQRRGTAVFDAEETPRSRSTSRSFTPSGSFSSGASDSEERGFDSLFFRVIDVEAAAVAEQAARPGLAPSPGPRPPAPPQLSPNQGPSVPLTDSAFSFYSPTAMPRGDGAMDLRNSPLPSQELSRLHQLQETGKQVQKRRARAQPQLDRRGSDESRDDKDEDDDDDDDDEEADSGKNKQAPHARRRTRRAHHTLHVPTPGKARHSPVTRPYLPSALSASTPAFTSHQLRGHMPRSRSPPPPTTTTQRVVHAPLVDGRVDVPSLPHHSRQPSLEHNAAGAWTTTHTNWAPNKPSQRPSSAGTLMPTTASVGELRTCSREYAVLAHDRTTGMLRSSSVVEVEELHSAVRRPVAWLAQVSCEESPTTSAASSVTSHASSSAGTATTPPPPPSRPRLVAHTEPRPPSAPSTGSWMNAARPLTRGVRRPLGSAVADPPSLSTTAPGLRRGARRRPPMRIDDEDDDDHTDEDENGSDEGESVRLAQTQPSVRLRQEAEARFSATFSGATRRELSTRHRSAHGRPAARSASRSHDTSLTSAPAALHLGGNPAARARLPAVNAIELDDSPLLHGRLCRSQGGVAGHTLSRQSTGCSSASLLLANTPILDISELLGRHSPSTTNASLPTPSTASGLARAVPRTTIEVTPPCASEREPPHGEVLTPDMPSISMSSSLTGPSSGGGAGGYGADASTSSDASGVFLQPCQHHHAHHKSPHAIAALRAAKFSQSTTSGSSESTTSPPQSPAGGSSSGTSAMPLSPGVFMTRYQPSTPEMTMVRFSASPLFPDERAGGGSGGAVSPVGSSAVAEADARCGTPLSVSDEVSTLSVSPPRLLCTLPLTTPITADAGSSATSTTTSNAEASTSVSLASRSWAIPVPPSTTFSGSVSGSVSGVGGVHGGGVQPSPPSEASTPTRMISARPMLGRVVAPLLSPPATPPLVPSAHQRVKSGSLSADPTPAHRHSPTAPTTSESVGDALLAMGLSTSGSTTTTTTTTASRQEVMLPSAAGQLLRFTPVDLSGSVRLLNVSYNANSLQASSFSLPTNELASDGRSPLSSAPFVLSLHHHGSPSRVSPPGFPLGQLPATGSPEAAALQVTALPPAALLQASLTLTATTASNGGNGGNAGSSAVALHLSPASSAHVGQSPLSVPLSPRRTLTPTTTPRSTINGAWTGAASANMTRSPIGALPLSRAAPCMAPAQSWLPAGLVGGVDQLAARARSPVQVALDPADPSRHTTAPITSVASDPLCAGELEDDLDGDSFAGGDVGGDHGIVQWVGEMPLPTLGVKPRAAPGSSPAPGRSLSALSISTVSRTSSNPLSPDDDDV